MNLLELEVSCPECGGNVVWTEQQFIGRCSYCSSVLCFEPGIEHRFYVEPRVKTREDLKQVLALWKAEAKRAEVVGRLRAGENGDQPSMLSIMDVELAPFLRQFESNISVNQASLIYVPYWHHQAVLFQSLLAVDEHGSKEYFLRRVSVDQAVPAYDHDNWNFRDRGLRFKAARFKEVTRELLSTSTHLPFTFDSAALFDAIVRAWPPAEPASLYMFKYYMLSEQRKLPVLRPYWIVTYQCDGEETVLVDACFQTVAGHPEREEAERFFAYRGKPLAPAQTPALKVISSRCPECGVDADWGTKEKIHFCGNCGRALVLRSGEVVVQPYDYAATEQTSSIFLPFWRFHVRLVRQNREYANLADYFRPMFMDRLLKGRAFSNFLSIPAFRIHNTERGDQLLSELIAFGCTSGHELMEGPMQPISSHRSGEVDAVAASEMLNAALPSASGIVPTLHKSGNLMQMLKETTVRFDEARLVLLPVPVHGEYLVVNSNQFAVALLDQE